MPDDARGASRVTAVKCPAAMSIAAKKSVRIASGIAFVGAAVACGSQDFAGPYGGELGGDFGIVGSGGRGSGYGGDGGSDGGRRDSGLDGGRADGSSNGGPGVDGGSGNGGNGGQHDAGADAGLLDGGSAVAVTFDWPPGIFASLDWVISGPSGYYSGTVYFGDAHSLEFVAGGIQAGSGYTITLAGNDRYGGPCSGTSAPFEVFAGEVSGVGVVLTCNSPPGASEPANVTTGSVGVEAGVVFHDM
jgi:hypothetical protein